jgi:type II secretory pathway pseudopilin PulG
MRASDRRGPPLPWSVRHRCGDLRGTSMVDLLAVLTVIGIASGIAFASVERSTAAARETGAARAFTMRVRQTRLEAVRRSAGVGLHFVTTSSAPSFRLYADGNGNGVRTREIASGIDPPLGPAASLDDGLGGVRFARAPDIPGVGDDDDAVASASGGSGEAADDGSGAIRVGAAGLLSFGPTGSGTSGTIYLRGATSQFAVRVYGPTGRVRLMEFDRLARAWVER